MRGYHTVLSSRLFHNTVRMIMGLMDFYYFYTCLFSGVKKHRCFVSINITIIYTRIVFVYIKTLSRCYVIMQLHRPTMQVVRMFIYNIIKYTALRNWLNNIMTFRRWFFILQLLFFIFLSLLLYFFFTKNTRFVHSFIYLCVPTIFKLMLYHVNRVVHAVSIIGTVYNIRAVKHMLKGYTCIHIALKTHMKTFFIS